MEDRIFVLENALQMKKEESDEKIRLKAYSTKELADLYGVSEKKFRYCLSPFKNHIGQKIGCHYTPRQAKIIFEKVGIPEYTTLE